MQGQSTRSFGETVDYEEPTDDITTDLASQGSTEADGHSGYRPLVHLTKILQKSNNEGKDKVGYKESTEEPPSKGPPSRGPPGVPVAIGAQHNTHPTKSAKSQASHLQLTLYGAYVILVAVAILGHPI